MKSITRPAAASLLLLIALTITAVSQTKRQTPPKTPPKPVAAPAAPAPTFDTLVPADSYAIYGEIRGVGQLIKSSAMTEILEPILKLAGPPKEFRSIVKWLDAHAEEVMTSRLLVATWATGKDLPEVVIALEFATAAEAAKFVKPLNEFLPTVLPPRMVDVSADTPGQSSKTPIPNFYLQQAGTLVLLSPKPLNLKKLKPAGSKPLSEEVNFRTARNRLNSEPVFVFVDVKGIERQSEEQRKRYEETRRLEEERIKKENAAREEEPKKMEEAEAPPAQEEFEVVTDATLGTEASSEVKETVTPDAVSTSLSAIGTSLFSLTSDWPDTIAVALSFENESFDLRALLINDASEKSDAIPFMPMLIPGPPLLPETPNILPADTELFVTMSVDLPQIYTLLSKPRPNLTFTQTSHGNLQNGKQGISESPFAAIEEQLKLNLKDDLLPLLGSEMALRLPVKDFDMLGLPRPPGPMPVTKTPTPSMAPAVLISVKDKDALRALLPKLVESLGFKGASALAQTERREDTEIVSFANMFSYAFVGNFLVISGEPATTRHIVDSYLKHETLSSDGQFRSYTRWQPRPMLGQVYISPALMESYKTWAEEPSTRVSDQTRAFLTRLTMVPQPVTYALSNEGLGALHELHLPKNLVLMAIAGISAQSNPPPSIRNERNAVGMLYTIAGGQEQYKAEKGNGSYGTLEQLIAAEFVPKEMLDNSGYRFEVTVTGDKFEISATPVEYGKTGNMSYFMDHTRTIRGADRNGATATSSDPPIY